MMGLRRRGMGRCRSGRLLCGCMHSVDGGSVFRQGDGLCVLLSPIYH